MKLQRCPVCNGAGHVSRPPHIPGDVNEWSASGIYSYSCHSCEGKGYIKIEDGKSWFVDLSNEETLVYK